MVSQMLSEEKQTLNIIPKKANIDLKRSLQPKLDKLRRRTEKTIVSILSNT
jgi:coiled-coil domain-containing protein 12